MKDIQIIFVEDRYDTRAQVKTALDLAFKDKIKLTIDECATFDEAAGKIGSKRYHLAILDMQLVTGMQGVEIITEKIIDTQLLPIIVYSKLTKDPLVVELSKRNHKFVHILGEKDHKLLISKIEEWNEQGVFDIYTEDGILEKQIVDLLRNAVWENLSRFWDDIKDLPQDEKIQASMRIAINFIADDIANQNMASVDGPVIHHSESYIHSKRNDCLAPGDIVVLKTEKEGTPSLASVTTGCNDVNWIVISPRCDLIFHEGGEGKDRKANLQRVMMAQILPLSMDSNLMRLLSGLENGLNHTAIEKNCKKINSHIETLGLTEDIQCKLEDKIKEILSEEKSSEHAISMIRDEIEKTLRHSNNNESSRFFYLPPTSFFTGGRVDFRTIRQVEYNVSTFDKLLRSRVISISPEMIGEFFTRYSRYISRFGQPAYMSNPLIETLSRKHKSKEL